jgi:hypothetical protein
VRRREGPRRLSHGQPGHEPDRECPDRPAEAGHPAARRLGIGQQPLGVGQKLSACVGQPGARPVSLEQLSSEIALQRTDLARQHRLRDMQSLGGPTVVQLLG